MWYLIVSIPDFCTLTYFFHSNLQVELLFYCIIKISCVIHEHTRKKIKHSSAMHALLNGLYRCCQWDRSTSNLSVVWNYLSFLFKLQLKIMLGKSEDPDRAPHIMASDLGLHCLSMSHKNEMSRGIKCPTM